MIRIFAGLALLAMCSGCALTKAEIEVPYVQGAPAAPVAGASGASVDVQAMDGRTANRDRVGVKKNGYGMEMAPIVAKNDLTATVADAFKTELAARGFRIGAGGADMQVALVRFYNDFKSGLLSGGVAGAVIGGTAGGLIGGRGAGAVLGAAIGIGAGALAGAAAESAAQPPDGVSYTVRMDDGRVVTVVQHLNKNEMKMPPGSRVRITTEGQFQRVSSDAA